jgi:hypothetical protein
MKALKYYDKEGVGFELFIHYEKQSIMLLIDGSESCEQPVLEFDDQDIDDIILAIAELKKQLSTYKNISSN